MSLLNNSLQVEYYLLILGFDILHSSNLVQIGFFGRGEGVTTYS